MKKTFLKLANVATMVAVAALSFTSCSDDTQSGDAGDAGDITYLSGNLETQTLDASKTYVISGAVVVGDGVTLTVPAGMTISAKAGFGNYILVDRGGKMNVNGTASAPVTFNCVDEDSNWGGLIINGYAPVSGSSASGNEGATEISNAYAYGGTNEADNSGSYTYMILDKTGAKSSGSVEHNGLTLNGVGNGTVIENIFVLATADDGVEFFGGSVNVTNLLVVNSDDDMFDFTQGYTGTLKNCYGIWEDGYTSTESDPRGVEADGNLDGLATDTDYNQSNFTIENMTIRVDSSFEMHDAIKIRRGAKATIINALVTGSGAAPADLIDFVDSKGDAASGTYVSVTSDFNCVDMLVATDASDYTVDYSTTSNTGCAASLFSWTGYEF
ncbi:MAG: hypothetical protein SNG02_07415 [Rikenellaceae bacterium]